MEIYKVTQAEKVTVIELDRFKVMVERNRRLTSVDNGAIAEATLYKETSTFIESDKYTFEVVADDGPAYVINHVNKLDQVITLFLTSILNAEYYLKSYPECSSLNYKNRVTLTDLKNEDQDAKLLFKAIC